MMRSAFPPLFRCLLLVGSVFGPFTPLSQALATGPTLNEAVQAGLVNSKRLRKLDRQVQAAQQHTLRRIEWTNPEIRISRLSSEYFEEEGFDDLRIAMRLRLPRWGALTLSHARAQLGVSTIQLKQRQTRRQLADEVRRTYIDTCFQQQLEELAKQVLTWRTKQRQAIERLIPLGHKSIIDRARSIIDTSQANEQLLDFTEKHHSSVRKLRRLTADKTIRADQLACQTLLSLVIDQPEALETAQQQRPELAYARQQAAYRTAFHRHERLRLVPRFRFVELSYNLEASRPDWWGLKLGLTIPLFNFHIARRRSAQLLADSAVLNIHATMQDIEREVAHAFQRVRQLQTALETLTKQQREIDQLVSPSLRGDQQAVLGTFQLAELELIRLQLCSEQVKRQLRLAHAIADLWHTMALVEITSYTAPEGSSSSEN